MAVGATAPHSFSALQPYSEVGKATILSLLRRAQRSGARLDCGLSRKIERRSAAIESIGEQALVLTDANFIPERDEHLRVAFDLEGRPYCFESSVLEVSRGRAVLDLPRSISHGERRSRERVPAPLHVQEEPFRIERGSESIENGQIIDASPEGISVRVPEHPALTRVGEEVSVRRGGVTEYGRIRHSKPLQQPAGWLQLGIELWPEKPQGVAREDFEHSRSQKLSRPQQVRRKVSVAASAVSVALERATQAFYARKSEAIRVVDYSDKDGRPIRGIIDAWGDPRGATAVVIPPAWGRTKETLLPLAHTVVSSFRAAKQPIRVLRFDGVGKRGESYREPVARAPGSECVRMRFSQGVEDIRAAVNYLHGDPAALPAKTLVVSFSAASIEARRAVVADERIGGWVCVVGSADLQSMMKRISGGVDYALGIERGVSFGLQEILGVTVDMDLAGRDALDHNLVYMADARRDMTQIDVPVTWVYGRADAWMDVDRVKDILSQGDSSARCLVGTPMGHMLRSSQEALSIFHFVACELSRMAGKAQVLPVRPALPELVRRQQAERKRRPAARPDLRRFWETYLLGGEEGGGYGVLTAISPFAEFMKSQIASLEVNTESVVVDLGSGTGEFLAHVGRVPKRVIELDLVRAALLQVREKMEGARGEVDFVQTDLGSSIPLASESADRVIASLLLSYVPNPERLLREIQRVLRPGGRLVASTLIADADMSKLYVEGVQELKTGLGAASEGIASDQVLRSFTNHASRLLDLEEQGDFRFWEPDTFRRLLTRTGWEVHSLARSFGRPPQAIIISASKPG